MKHVLLLLLFSCWISFCVAQRAGTVQIFPNPATEYIEVTAKQEIKEITIINMIGRRVKSFRFVDDQRYYIGDLPQGMYLVQFIDTREKVLTTHRVNKR